MFPWPAFVLYFTTVRIIKLHYNAVIDFKYSYCLKMVKDSSRNTEYLYS